MTVANARWSEFSESTGTVFHEGPLTTSSWGHGDDSVVYMYFDESGNFDFRESGTPYFLMTCAVTKRPFHAGRQLTDLRFDLIEEDHPLERFHACEDVDVVRRLVYRLLDLYQDAYRVYAVLVDKSSVPSEFRTPESIYSKVFELIVDEVAEKELRETTRKVVAITDSLPKDAKKRQVEGPLKRFMKRRFQNVGVPYMLLHHSLGSDPNLQAVDYFCWAAHRDLTQGKDWPMTVVAPSFIEVGNVEFTDEEEIGDTPS